MAAQQAAEGGAVLKKLDEIDDARDGDHTAADAVAQPVHGQRRERAGHLILLEADDVGGGGGIWIDLVPA